MAGKKPNVSASSVADGILAAFGEMLMNEYGIVLTSVAYYLLDGDEADVIE